MSIQHVQLDEMRPVLRDRIERLTKPEQQGDELSIHPQLTLLADTGVGKTTVSLEIALKELGLRVLVLAPTNALANEVCNRWGAEGIKAAPIVGRDAEIEVDIGKDGEPIKEPICQKSDVAHAIRHQADLAMAGAFLCYRGVEVRCEHWDECQYISQYGRAKDAQLVTMSHQAMCYADTGVERSTEGFGRFDLIVVDEDFKDVLVDLGHEYEQNFERFKSYSVETISKLSKEHKEYVEQVMSIRGKRKEKVEFVAEGEGVEGGVAYEWDTTLVEYGLGELANLPMVLKSNGDVITWYQRHQDLIDTYLKWRQSNAVLGINPSMGAEVARARVRAIKESAGVTPSELPYRALLTLQQDMNDGRDPRIRWAEMRFKSEDGESETGSKPVIRYSRRKRPLRLLSNPYGETVRTLFLDATMNEDIFREMVADGYEVPALKVDSGRNAVVIQVTDRGFSHSWFDNQLKSAAGGRVNEIIGLRTFLSIMAHQLGMKALFIGPKSVDEFMEAGGFDVEHFGALRGIDAYKDHTAAVISGRLLPRPYEVEDLAWAWAPEAIERIPEGEWYPKAKVTVTPKQGDPVEFDAVHHPDPWVNEYLKDMLGSEIVQAIGRLRLVHRDEPALVFVLNQVELPFQPDHVIGLSHLLGPNRAMTILASCDGVFPASPEYLLTHFPEHFVKKGGRTPSPAAAKEFRRKLGGAPRVQWLPGRDLYSPHLVTYTVGGNKSPRKAATIRGYDTTEELLSVIHEAPATVVRDE